MPRQATELQNQFLVTPDGRCSLPVAYTLAYAYLGRNKLATWTSFLDNQLLNTNLTGDLRVNWLLARALTQEISQAPPSITLSTHVYTRPTDGMNYVNQAVQAAQSAPVKMRAAQEAAARLASAGQFDAATVLLQPLLNSVPADQQVILTGWLNQLAGLSAVQANAAANQSAAAQQAYLASVRQRRDQAAAAGNTAAVSRYNAILNALTSQ